MTYVHRSSTVRHRSSPGHHRSSPGHLPLFHRAHCTCPVRPPGAPHAHRLFTGQLWSRDGIDKSPPYTATVDISKFLRQGQHLPAFYIFGSIYLTMPPKKADKKADKKEKKTPKARKPTKKKGRGRGKGRTPSLSEEDSSTHTTPDGTPGEKVSPARSRTPSPKGPTPPDVSTPPERIIVAVEVHEEPATGRGNRWCRSRLIKPS